MSLFITYDHHHMLSNSLFVLQIFPNASLQKLRECIAVRDRLLSRKLEEHKVTNLQVFL